MFCRQLAPVAALLGLVIALPTTNESPIAPQAVSTADNGFLASRANGGNMMMLIPAPRPGRNATDLSKLLATKNLQMYYASDPNPNANSMVATLTAPTTPHPFVSLEDTHYIQSVDCTDNEATIKFNNAAAYQAAAKDWQQHPQFILTSYNPKCGRGVASGERDYILVNKVTRHDASRTVKAAMQFVDFGTAVGNTTNIHLSVGRYQAPLSKRDFLDPFNDIVSDFTNVASAVVNVVSQVPAAASAVVSDVGSVISDLPTPNIHEDFPLSWHEFPTNSLTTQDFGSGIQLLKSDKLDAICAGCGVDGNLDIAAELDFSVTGIKNAQLTITGSMKGTMALGLVGRNASVPIPIASVPIAALAPTSFLISSIATIGPQLDISASAKVELDLTGNFLVGATLEWDNINVSLSLTDKSSNSGNGLVPKLTPQFKADAADASATLDLSFPISLGFGVKIPLVKFDKQVSVVETPGFSLKAADSKADASCPGVSLSADFSNNVEINVLDLTTFGLESTTIPLTSTCLAAKATPSSSATVVPTGSSAINSSSNIGGKSRATRNPSQLSLQGPVSTAAAVLDSQLQTTPITSAVSIATSVASASTSVSKVIL